MSYKIAKRIFDVVASLLAMVVFLIPWVIIGLLIKILSPGPVLYKPERVGKDGKKFILYKFRSMRVDSGTIHATTLRNDPRIFPFGSFLRISKLDETPQLINILKGEMSVIGPRPEDKINADKQYVGKYRDILKVKPGLSSPASLYDYMFGELYKDETLYVKEFLPKKLELELYYVQNQSALYDLQLIWRTIVIIMQMICGKKDFQEPREVALIEEK